MDEAAERIVIQVAMLNKLRPHFEAWLRSMGMDLVPMPGNPVDIGPLQPGDLPTYIVIPDREQIEELLARRDELLRQLDDDR